MYEQQTFEVILKRMLDRVPADIDKREGSIIYDALAPAAAELAQMYMEFDVLLNLSFADTATGEWLARRAAEFGIDRKLATKARRKGLFYNSTNALLDVPIGSRFSIGGLNYKVIERLATGQFSLECETSGAVGNQQFGPMLPIDYIAGLSRAELADVLVPGEDEESDEALRKRYFEAVREQPFGGNVADYKQKISGVPGVGGVKVFPAWQGGGTVKCTIIGADFNSPSAILVDEVQTAIDPVQNSGQGLGLAPIGHQVTIAGVQGVTVNVTTTVTLQSGVTLGQVQGEIESVISDYLLSLRQMWADEDNLIVRVSQIEARILTVDGVTDVAGTTLNGVAANLELQSEQIPMLGTVTINVG
ncbi:baseplate J/gp47 family protein [Paenibacillus naphthalenovorans]|uniref:baseplate J/gp47 family protein n=1 Tax=Paenibacillus naphthalenovorans TaxID=162209 RepID=UPI003D295DEE